MTIKNWPLWLQLSAALVIATLIAGLIAGKVVRDMARDYLVGALEQQSQKTLAMIAASSIDALITEDRPVLDSIVTEVSAADPNILHLIIYDEEQRVLAHFQRPDAAQATEYLDFRRAVIVEDEDFGSMDIRWNTQSLLDGIEHHVSRMQSLVMGAMVLLSLLVLLVLRLTVILPVDRIHTELTRLSNSNGIDDQLGQRLATAHRSRELKRVADGVELFHAHQIELLNIQKTLEVARDNAEAASKAKSEFLAVMSHEIRTPIHGVLGSLDLLRDNRLDKDQANFADTAYRSAETLLGIINNILDFSKIEAGGMTLENIRFDLHRLVEEVTAMLYNNAAGKGLELACFIAADVPQFVHGDPVRLRQIITNLTGNAIKFTQQGEVSIFVSRVDATDDETQLQFEIRDTGIGIPKAVIPTLFQSFTQADSSTTRHFGGTGLGLAISKRLAELMGGDIEVFSDPGKGSRFVVKCRMGKAHQNPEITQDSFPEVPVLVVDDNQTNREILHHYLRNWGMRPELAASATDALELIRQRRKRSDEPFRLALLDWHMPEMNGIQLARTLKADPRLQDMHLMMLSSQTDPLQSTTDSGIEINLTKPVRQSLLFDAIREILTTSPADDTKAKSTQPEPELPPLSGKILLVEDNLVNQMVASKMLERFGLDIDIAENGALGLEAVQHGQYDIVLMDAHMPVMDGFEATRQIRSWQQDTKRPHQIIIAMTANAMEGDRDQCLDAGMDDYLPKPVKKEVLHQTLKRWLEDTPKPE